MVFFSRTVMAILPLVLRITLFPRFLTGFFVRFFVLECKRPSVAFPRSASAEIVGTEGLRG